MLNDQTMKEVYAPFISIVSAPSSCVTPLGKMILEADVDLTARLLFMQKMHKTHPGTGAVCTAAAIRIPGTGCCAAAPIHGRSFTSAIRPGSWTSRASVIWRRNSGHGQACFLPYSPNDHGRTGVRSVMPLGGLNPCLPGGEIPGGHFEDRRIPYGKNNIREDPRPRVRTGKRLGGRYHLGERRPRDDG